MGVLLIMFLTLTHGQYWLASCLVDSTNCYLSHSCLLIICKAEIECLIQVVDETDRLLREAYQSWLPTVLQLAQSSTNSQFPFGDAINRPAFGFLKTVRSLWVSFPSCFLLVDFMMSVLSAICISYLILHDPVLFYLFSSIISCEGG